MNTHKTLLVFFMLLSQLVYSQNDNYEQAVQLFNVGNQMQAQMKFSEAKESFSLAAELFEQSGYIENHIQCKISEALVWLAEGKLSESEKILRYTEQKTIDEFGEQSNLLVIIYYTKGQIEFQKGQMQEALAYFERALNIQAENESENPLFKAQILSGAGNVYSSFGKHQRAYEFYMQDLSIRLSVAGERAPELDVTYNNIGIALRNMNRSDEALKYFDKGIEYNALTGQSQNLILARLYSGKGGVFFDTGQYTLAMQFMQRALEMKQQILGRNHRLIADEYNNIGMVQRTLGDNEQAILSFRRAYDMQRQVLSRSHPDLAVTCNNLASVLQADGRIQTALQFYTEAIQITQNTFGDTHPNLGGYYHNVASVYKAMNDFENALEYYRYAEKIYLDAIGSRAQALILIYVSMADAYRRTGDYDKALSYYQTSIKVNTPDFEPQPDDLFSNPALENYSDLNYLLYAVSGKADVLTQMFLQDSINDYAQFAFNAYVLSDSIISLQRRSVFDEADRLWTGNKARDIYETAVLATANLAYLQADLEKRDRYFRKAFYFSEKNKAAILSDAVSAAEAKQFSGIPDSLLENERSLNNQISVLKQKLLQAPDEETQHGIRKQLLVSNNDLMELGKYIEMNYPEYYQAKYQQTMVSTNEIQRSLSASQLIRSYFFSADQLIIFSITRSDISIHSEDIPENFEQTVLNLRNYITSGRVSDFSLFIDTANEIYNILFPQSLPEHISELIIIPDAYLGIVPFEALITEPYSGDPMHFNKYPFLIKDINISYFYSADLFLKAKQNPYKAGELSSWLGLAPVFSDMQVKSFAGFSVTELPATLEEINQIHSNLQLHDSIGYYGKIIGKEATKDVFLNLNLANYQILHIATHGFVDTEHPELSGLLFYPQETKEASILYSGEIYNLQLNSNLVVLSACETGLGKISRSEGIIGLTRSFLFAGAQNIIVSFWAVEDQSTSLFMQLFYKYLPEGNNYSQALHKAKLQLIYSGEKYAHPFFWSPFVLIGN